MNDRALIAHFCTRFGFRFHVHTSSWVYLFVIMVVLSACTSQQYTLKFIGYAVPTQQQRSGERDLEVRVSSMVDEVQGPLRVYLKNVSDTAITIRKDQMMIAFKDTIRFEQALVASPYVTVSTTNATSITASETSAYTNRYYLGSRSLWSQPVGTTEGVVASRSLQETVRTPDMLVLPPGQTISWMLNDYFYYLAVTTSVVAREGSSDRGARIGVGYWASDESLVKMGQEQLVSKLIGLVPRESIVLLVPYQREGATRIQHATVTWDMSLPTYQVRNAGW